MPKVELNLPELPKGYEYTGEYRTPRIGELFMDYHERVRCLPSGNPPPPPPPAPIVKRVRWRAADGEGYYFVTSKSVEYITEWEEETDDEHYNFGNYFQTREQAEAAREKVREVLLACHTTE